MRCEHVTVAAARQIVLEQAPELDREIERTLLERALTQGYVSVSATEVAELDTVSGFVTRFRAISDIFTRISGARSRTDATVVDRPADGTELSEVARREFVVQRKKHLRNAIREGEAFQMTAKEFDELGQNAAWMTLVEWRNRRDKK